MDYRQELINIISNIKSEKAVEYLYHLVSDWLTLLGRKWTQ